MTVKRTVYMMDRRDLLKWSAVGAAGFAAADLDEAFAQNQCDKTDEIVTLPNGTSPGDTEFFYWIDGHFSKPWGSSLPTRAKMAVHVDLPQKPDRFVESVLLIEKDTRKIIEERHLRANDKISRDLAPYVVFDNLVLDQSKDYSVVYTLRANAKEVLVFKYDIPKENVRESRFDFSHLAKGAFDKIPSKFIQDMDQAAHRFKAGTPEDKSMGFGNITSVYHHFAGLGDGTSPLHTARGRLESYGSDGKFSVRLQPMHADLSPDHFMRYFLVLDPVGRILGGKKRAFDANNKWAGGSASANLITGGFVVMEPGMFDDPRYTSPTVTAEEQAEIKARRIGDCPYIMIFTEDINDAIARTTLRLR